MFEDVSANGKINKKNTYTSPDYEDEAIVKGNLVLFVDLFNGIYLGEQKIPKNQDP